MNPALKLLKNDKEAFVNQSLIIATTVAASMMAQGLNLNELNYGLFLINAIATGLNLSYTKQQLKDIIDEAFDISIKLTEDAGYEVK